MSQLRKYFHRLEGFRIPV